MRVSVFDASGCCSRAGALPLETAAWNHFHTAISGKAGIQAIPDLHGPIREVFQADVRRIGEVSESEKVLKFFVNPSMREKAWRSRARGAKAT